MKTLFVAAGLFVGQSVWGAELELYKQNYQEATDASSWSSSDAGALPLNLRTVSENKYIEAGRATNSRYVYTDFFTNNTAIASTFYGAYTSYKLSFDIILYGGARQPSDFAVMANGHVMPNTAGKNYLQTAGDWNTHTNPYLFYLKNAVPDGGSTDDDVKQTFYINETSTSVRMPSDGTWCTVVLEVTESSVDYSIKNKSTSAVLQSGSYTIPDGHSCFAQGIFSFLHKNSGSGANQQGGDMCIDNILITTEVTGEAVTSPSIAVAYAGANRTVTITPGVSSASNPVTTYYTTDGSDPTSLSAVYSSPLDIAADCTVKAISISSTSVSSAIVSQAVTVGKLPLNAPTIAITGFVLNDGVYNATYSFTSDQSGVEGSPTASLTYSFAGADAVAGTSYTPSATGTLRVTASADGYTSTYTDYNVACAQYFKSYVFDATSAISLNGDPTPTYNNYSINSTGCKLYALGDCIYTTEKSISFDNKMQFAWAITANQAYCLFARTGASTVSYTLNSGEYIEFTNFGTPIISSSATTSTQLAWYTPVRQINVYTPMPATVVTLANGDAKHLTFNNATNGSQTWENWLIALYGNGTKAAQVRADWWDDIAATNTGFTYPYTYSGDNGATAGTGNLWTTFQSDMADADIDFTLTYNGGTFYVIGTMTKGTNVYYVNFSKSGLTGKVYYYLYANNATLTNINTAATSVLTTPAHPTAISAGNVGSTGLSTFASTLYPLDLNGISGAEVYYAEAVNGSTVKFKSTDASVPAGEGLLLKGTASTAVTINIADAGTAISGNLLKGCIAETAGVSGADKYVLVNNSGNAEFQNLGTTPATIPAGKAYLDASGAGARSLTIVFDDDDVTGVNEVRSQKEDVRSEWFDLQGRKVAQPAKGLYIVNGKKVVIK